MTLQFADAICEADLIGVEYDPSERCVDCGAEIGRGLDTCDACDAKRELFEINSDDPRR